MSADGVEPALRRYLDIWTRIDAHSVDRLRDVLAPDARFADPFHDVTGIDAVIAVLKRAYGRLRSVDVTVDAVAVTGGRRVRAVAVRLCHRTPPPAVDDRGDERDPCG